MTIRKKEGKIECEIRMAQRDEGRLKQNPKELAQPTIGGRPKKKHAPSGPITLFRSVLLIKFHHIDYDDCSLLANLSWKTNISRTVQWLIVE